MCMTRWRLRIVIKTRWRRDRVCTCLYVWKLHTETDGERERNRGVVWWERKREGDEVISGEGLPTPVTCRGWLPPPGSALRSEPASTIACGLTFSDVLCMMCEYVYTYIYTYTHTFIHTIAVTATTPPCNVQGEQSGTCVHRSGEIRTYF